MQYHYKEWLLDLLDDGESYERRKRGVLREGNTELCVFMLQKNDKEDILRIHNGGPN